jgi:hypothetical protein
MSTTVMAYGSTRSPALPDYGIGAGLQTAYGTWLPPSSDVIYVRSTRVDRDSPSLERRRVATLAAAPQQCRSGAGDTIFVLPGHSENVTDATMIDNLVPGTRIIGCGWGSNRPVFRFTATGAQWVLNDADVQIMGLRLRLEGANGVVKAIVVTAADCLIQGCDIEMASGAALKATIGIEIGAGADRAALVGNVIRGTADVVTDPVKVVAAIPGVTITSNRIYCAGTSATGVIHVTAAATNLFIAGNAIDNLAASSIAAIGIDNVAASGSISYNTINVLATGAHTSNTSGIALGAGALVRAHQNFSSNDARASGLLQPAVDT